MSPTYGVDLHIHVPEIRWAMHPEAMVDDQLERLVDKLMVNLRPMIAEALESHIEGTVRVALTGRVEWRSDQPVIVDVDASSPAKGA